MSNLDIHDINIYEHRLRHNIKYCTGCYKILDINKDKLGITFCDKCLKV